MNIAASWNSMCTHLSGVAICNILRITRRGMRPKLASQSVLMRNSCMKKKRKKLLKSQWFHAGIHTRVYYAGSVSQIDVKGRTIESNYR